MINKLIRFCLENKLIVLLLMLVVLAWGVMTAPFDWDVPFLERNPVAVDAIPDIGENQQIVFTDWEGRSPQDVENQITYPLTVALLGLPEVKTIRSYSMFGFSSIYIIFEEKAEFYWARSRILEKLNSLPSGTLPEGVQPALGPDATALGQVFWYTLEGCDADGQPTGGWDLPELRRVQDWYVRFGLLAAGGVAEVASVGGFVQEYQIDVDPDAMRAYRVGLNQVIEAVQMSNIDVGARSIEINKADYVIRGVGFVKTIADLENAVITVNNNVPVYVKNVAKVSKGPALRQGALDKEGAEAVGGVVVVRYGENPLEAIKNVKRKIAEISPGLPKKTLPDGTISQIKIVPFYDRTGLIYETLGTLSRDLYQQILITVLVLIVMIAHVRSSLLVSMVLPFAVLMCFIAMKIVGVDANIMALAGIAIAIGTTVDMGIVICDNILYHLAKADPAESRLAVIFRAVSEVGGALVSAVTNTIIGFLPVFLLEGAEGKMFRPLAFTKTFTLIASMIVALTIVPPLAHWLFTRRNKRLATESQSTQSDELEDKKPDDKQDSNSKSFLRDLRVSVAKNIAPSQIGNALLVLVVLYFLSAAWLPLGPEPGAVANMAFVGLIVGGLLAIFLLFRYFYPVVLGWCLHHKKTFLSIPLFSLLIGLMVWIGFDAVFSWLPQPLRTFAPVSYVAHKFPGLGKEFMPPFDEGSYLFMPSVMPHASISEALNVIQTQDMAIRAIPEVSEVVGKIGRVESALDPAPLSMIETVINYVPDYIIDADGNRLTFKFEADSTDIFRLADGRPAPAPDGQPYVVQGKFARDSNGKLIPDPKGRYFRQWRPALDPDLNPGRAAWPGIQKPDDIWAEIIRAAEVPGVTSAPKLQPIATRIVMLQSGMRAAMGLKIKGPDLATIEKVGLEIEKILREIPAINAASVFADRIVGTPYLEIEIDRLAIARYGIKLQEVQDVIESAIGGRPITTTVEGRERYPVRVRYQRERRDSIEDLHKILVPAMGGAQIPLAQLAQIVYKPGPQMIKSEDTFLIGYVLFDKNPGWAEVDVVEQARNLLTQKIAAGQLEIPAGVSYTFAGSYENQIRAQKKLIVIVPFCLLLVFIIIYFEFRSLPITIFVFSGIGVAVAGGFMMLWLYGQDWFLNFSLFGVDMRELMRVGPVNLSVAVWVGFIALMGVAEDDGVIMATYLEQSFHANRPMSVEAIRAATLEGGQRRVRACLMTTVTSVIALLPVITATGRGADIMMPMALPIFGGMTWQVITMLIVPVLYCWREERRLKAGVVE